MNFSPFGYILHATAFDSPAAFEHALCIGLAAKGQLDIVHVDKDDRPNTEDWELFPGVRSTLTRWGMLGEGAPTSAVSQLGLKVIKHDIAGSTPSRALMGYLEDGMLDLLVLGTRARDRLGQVLQPSVAEALARRSSAPTLFVPDSATGFVATASGAPRLENIVLPVGGPLPPTPAVDFALRLSALLDQDAALHFLHVENGQEPEMDEFSANTAGIRVSRKGPLVETICDYADEVDADLIVMTTAGHDSFRDAALGSTTEQVLRRAGRALVAVPA